MSDDVDPAEIADRTGVLEADARAVLDELRESQPESLVEAINSEECDPILVAVADGTRCEHCGERFDGDDVPTTPIPSTVLYLCPHCQRWTEA